MDLRPTAMPHDESTASDTARGVQRLVFRFNTNGSYFGVTQLLGETDASLATEMRDDGRRRGLGPERAR